MAFVWDVVWQGPPQAISPGAFIHILVWRGGLGIGVSALLCRACAPDYVLCFCRVCPGALSTTAVQEKEKTLQRMKRGGEKML